MQYYCPICNKAGLPDFHVQATICPQCNSDLKPFMLLHNIGKSHRLKLFTFIGAALAIIVLAVFVYITVNENRSLKSNYTLPYSQLKDSVNNRLPGIVDKTNEQTENKNDINDIVIHYKVKKGDYPAKIAAFFYDDWSMYKKIESDNNLKNHYTLQIGQTLIIKLKSE
jgi:hypothetical protein